MDYSQFSLEDFIQDKYFREWVLTPNEKTEMFWSSWQKNNPQKKQLIEDAKNIVLTIQYETYQVAPYIINEDWRRLGDSINKSEKHYKLYKLLNSRSLWFSAAASVLIVLAASLIYFVNYLQPNVILYSTTYGEKKEITLPDGSSVILNSNSELSYDERFNRNNTREVSIKGEAYFQVKKEKSKRKFIVFVNNGKIEVLGTSFNVNNRRGKTRVVLETGKVVVVANKIPEKQMNMVPGEMVELNEDTITKTLVEPVHYSSWKNNLIFFDDLPLNEIGKIIEDNYGIAIFFENNQIQERKFRGTFPADNIDILINSISKAYDLQVERKGESVIFK